MLRLDITLFGLLSGAYRHGQVAVHDIARTAATLLSDTSWSDVAGVGVFGPADVSLDEIAGWVGEALGAPVRYQQLAPGEEREMLRGFGVSEALVEAVIAIFVAIGAGLFDAEPRPAAAADALAMPQWIEDVFAPAFRNTNHE